MPPSSSHPTSATAAAPAKVLPITLADWSQNVLDTIPLHLRQTYLNTQQQPLTTNLNSAAVPVASAPPLMMTPSPLHRPVSHHQYVASPSSPLSAPIITQHEQHQQTTHIHQQHHSQHLHTRVSLQQSELTLLHTELAALKQDRAQRERVYAACIDGIEVLVRQMEGSWTQQQQKNDDYTQTSPQSQQLATSFSTSSTSLLSTLHQLLSSPASPNTPHSVASLFIDLSSSLALHLSRHKNELSSGSAAMRHAMARLEEERRQDGVMLSKAQSQIDSRIESVLEHIGTHLLILRETRSKSRLFSAWTSARRRRTQVKALGEVLTKHHRQTQLKHIYFIWRSSLLTTSRTKLLTLSSSISSQSLTLTTRSDFTQVIQWYTVKTFRVWMQRMKTYEANIKRARAKRLINAWNELAKLKLQRRKVLAVLLKRNAESSQRHALKSWYHTTIISPTILSRRRTQLRSVMNMLTTKATAQRKLLLRQGMSKWIEYMHETSNDRKQKEAVKGVEKIQSERQQDAMKHRAQIDQLTAEFQQELLRVREEEHMKQAKAQDSQMHDFQKTLEFERTQHQKELRAEQEKASKIIEKLQKEHSKLLSIEKDKSLKHLQAEQDKHIHDLQHLRDATRSQMEQLRVKHTQDLTHLTQKHNSEMTHVRDSTSVEIERMKSESENKEKRLQQKLDSAEQMRKQTMLDLESVERRYTEEVARVNRLNMTASAAAAAAAANQALPPILPTPLPHPGYVHHPQYYYPHHPGVAVAPPPLTTAAPTIIHTTAPPAPAPANDPYLSSPIYHSHTLKEQASVYEHRIHDLEDRHTSDISKLNASHETDLQRLGGTISHLQSQLEHTRAQLTKTREAYHIEHRRVKSMKKQQYDLVVKEAEELKHAAAIPQPQPVSPDPATLAQHASELEHVKELSAARQEHTRLQCELENVQRDYAQLKQAYDTLRQEQADALRVHAEQHAASEASVQEAKHKFAAAMEWTSLNEAELNAQHEKRLNEIALTHATELDHLKTDIVRLETLLSEQKDDMKKHLQTKQAEQETYLTTLEAQYYAQIETLRKEHADQLSALTEQHNTSSTQSHTEHTSQMHTLNEHHKSQLRELHARMQREYEKAEEEWRKEKENLISRMEKLKESYREVESRLTAANVNLTSRLATVTSDLNSLTSSHEQISNDRADLLDRNRKLAAALIEPRSALGSAQGPRPLTRDDHTHDLHTGGMAINQPAILVSSEADVLIRSRPGSRQGVRPLTANVERSRSPTGHTRYPSRPATALSPRGYGTSAAVNKEVSEIMYLQPPTPSAAAATSSPNLIVHPPPSPVHSQPIGMESAQRSPRSVPSTAGGRMATPLNFAPAATSLYDDDTTITSERYAELQRLGLLGFGSVPASSTQLQMTPITQLTFSPPHTPPEDEEPWPSKQREEQKRMAANEMKKRSEPVFTDTSNGRTVGASSLSSTYISPHSRAIARDVARTVVASSISSSSSYRSTTALNLSSRQAQMQPQYRQNQSSFSSAPTATFSSPLNQSIDVASLFQRGLTSSTPDSSP